MEEVHASNPPEEGMQAVRESREGGKERDQGTMFRYTLYSAIGL